MVAFHFVYEVKRFGSFIVDPPKRYKDIILNGTLKRPFWVENHPDISRNTGKTFKTNASTHQQDTRRRIRGTECFVSEDFVFQTLFLDITNEKNKLNLKNGVNAYTHSHPEG